MSRDNTNKPTPIQTETSWESGELFYVRVQGKLACFSRPEFKTSRVSYLIPSHSAANGILSAYLSHKGVSYSINRIGLLFYPTIVNIKGNEIDDFGKITNSKVKPINIETKRTQIVTSALFNVDYWMSFRICASSKEEVMKYRNMFETRLPLYNGDDITKMGGVWNHLPYLGIKEYVGSVKRINKEDIKTICSNMKNIYTHEDGSCGIDFSYDLGLMFYGKDYNSNKNYFTPMTIDHGVTQYPSWHSVKQLGITMSIS